MSLRFDWITTQRELDELRADWTLLDAGDTPGAVFRSWEWQATWWRHFSGEPGRRRALRVLVVRDDASGSARAILPMYVEDAPVAPLVERRRLALLADGVVGSDFLGIVAPEPERRALTVEIARRIAKDPMLADIDWIDLDGLIHDEPLGWALGGTLPEAGFEEVAPVHRARCPWANLGAYDRASYFASRPDGFGNQLKRRRKGLEKLPGFKLEFLGAPDEVAAGFDDLFRLHAARWAEDGGSEAFTGDAIESFHREAGRLLAERGWARLAFLSVGGERVACVYGFLRGERFDYYQSGLDPAWRQKSAGTVLLGDLIDRAFVSGVKEFDFLRGEETYKRTFATHIRDISSLRAVSSRGRARLAAGVSRAIVAIKDTAKRTLPDGAKEQLRRALGVARRLTS